jgi:hypothetical protein
MTVGYPGSKTASGIFQYLVNQMVPHDTYIEPFLGHGVILVRKRPAPLNIGIDRDPNTINVVSTHLRARRAQCSERAPRQKDIACSDVGPDEGISDDIVIGTARYRLLVADGLAFLRAYPFTGQELVYADPPYLRSARRDQSRLYRHEMTDQQHQDLLAILRGVPCAVMLSGYDNPLYRDLLHEWRTVTFQTMTRGGSATEVLWMNYPEPTSLHEYTFVGPNFRARERQKRQQTRWVNKVLDKPLVEQKRLLSGVLTAMDADTRADVLRSLPDTRGEEDLIVRTDTAAAAPQTARATRCTICRSPARARIDQALSTGEPIRDIAAREGVSKSVVGRHRTHGCPTSTSLPTGTKPVVPSTPLAEQLPLLSLETLA